MGIFHAAHQVKRVARHAQLELIFAIDGEIMLHQQSAARTERHTFDVLILGEIG